MADPGLGSGLHERPVLGDAVVGLVRGDHEHDVQAPERLDGRGVAVHRGRDVGTGEPGRTGGVADEEPKRVVGEEPDDAAADVAGGAGDADARGGHAGPTRFDRPPFREGEALHATPVRRGGPVLGERYFSSAELFPRIRRATISCWICCVPSKMSRILESRAHFSSRSCSL